MTFLLGTIQAERALGNQLAIICLILIGIIFAALIGAHLLNRNTRRLEAERNKESAYDYEGRHKGWL